MYQLVRKSRGLSSINQLTDELMEISGINP
jgi:hypothetical protein